MRWQYCILNSARTRLSIDYCDGRGPQPIGNNSTANVLRELGQNGWELVSVVNNAPIDQSKSYYFKRLIPQ
jgi:hypothetical protein